MPNVTLEDLYQAALEQFPHELEPTSITMGDWSADQDGYLEYSAEFTFTAGQLLDEPLLAGGWIELRQDSPTEDPSITAFFGVARHGDWKNGSILAPDSALQGQYDLQTRLWELWIDQY